MIEWISVKYRLPEGEEDILFFYSRTLRFANQGGRISTGYYDESNYLYDCWRAYIEDPDGETASIEIPLRYVTHWMPLPKGPEVK